MFGEDVTDAVTTPTKKAPAAVPVPVPRTPAAAESAAPVIAKTPVDDDPDLVGAIYSTPYFAIVPVQGRGYTWRALKKISAGRVLLREEPLAVLATSENIYVSSLRMQAFLKIKIPCELKSRFWISLFLFSKKA